MKKNHLFLIVCILLCMTFNAFSQALSPYPSKVLEYCPAPGQFINENYPVYETGDTPEIMKQKALRCLQTPDASGMVSLGAFGGYITLAFDHPIVNSRGDFDFKIYGNAFQGSFEPGIVMVSYDANKNGIADDPWFELKGSEYQKCLKNYQITYQRPNPLNGDIAWTDNQGNSGFVKRNTFHNQDTYYPLWIQEETLTFNGTLFPDSLLGKPGQWGYADNVENNSDLCKFKIDWAVDEAGNPANLSSIDFIKIYTAVNKCDIVSGETSTELAYPGVEDLHLNMAQHNIEQNTLDPYKDYYLLNMEKFDLQPNSMWDKTLLYNSELDPEQTGSNQFAFEQAPYIFNYATLYEGAAWEGFTYGNIAHATSSGYDNQFAAITDGGVEGTGKTYITSYYSSYSDINKQYFEFSDGKMYNIAGCYVTNTVLCYYTMLYGNAFAKKFGGETGTDPDWFKLTFTGIDVDGNSTGTVDFYLADFRSPNSANDYIVSNWRWVDLSALGHVAKVTYQLSSSDIGDYGMNTPSYFCLDKIAVEKEAPSTAYLSWIKIDGNLLEGFEPERVRYTLNWPSGTEPTVTAGAANATDQITITQAANVPGMAIIEVVPQEGASKTYTVTFDPNQGIEDELYGNNTRIYPNPFSDYLNLSGVADHATIRVFSLDGKLIYSASHNPGLINTNDWKQGLYIITIMEGKSQKTLKGIKK